MTQFCLPLALPFQLGAALSDGGSHQQSWLPQYFLRDIKASKFKERLLLCLLRRLPGLGSHDPTVCLLRRQTWPPARQLRPLHNHHLGRCQQQGGEQGDHCQRGGGAATALRAGAWALGHPLQVNLPYPGPLHYTAHCALSEVQPGVSMTMLQRQGWLIV